MYQIFFTHSSVDGHLDCFNFGAFMNSTMGLVAQMVKNRPAIWETWVRSQGQEDPLEKEMATHSSIHAWEIPWTIPGGPQAMGLQKSQMQLGD